MSIKQLYIYGRLDQTTDATDSAKQPIALVKGDSAKLNIFVVDEAGEAFDWAETGALTFVVREADSSDALSPISVQAEPDEGDGYGFFLLTSPLTYQLNPRRKYLYDCKYLDGYDQSTIIFSSPLAVLPSQREQDQPVSEIPEVAPVGQGPQGIQGIPGEAGYPDPTDHAGSFLATDGEEVAWQEIPTVEVGPQQYAFGDEGGNITSSASLAFDGQAVSVSTDSSDGGYGRVNLIVNSEASEAGIKLNNETEDGGVFTIISTGTGSGVGAGKFIVGDATQTQPRLTIDADGNVGIGEVDPDFKLDVAGETNANGVVIGSPENFGAPWIHGNDEDQCLYISAWDETTTFGGTAIALTGATTFGQIDFTINDTPQLTLNSGRASFVGSIDVPGAVRNTGAVSLLSTHADGSSAVAVSIDTQSSWSNPGAKLLSISNEGISKTWVDTSGNVHFDFNGAGICNTDNSTSLYVGGASGNNAGFYSSGGKFMPYNDAANSFGDSTHRWSAGYFGASSVGTANTASLFVSNSTAATVSAQQYSPAITMLGKTWETTGGTSQVSGWSLQSQGYNATAAVSKLMLSQNSNGTTRNALQIDHNVNGATIISHPDNGSILIRTSGGNSEIAMGTGVAWFGVSGTVGLNLNSDGRIFPWADNNTKLGTSAARWSDGYFVKAHIDDGYMEQIRASSALTLQPQGGNVKIGSSGNLGKLTSPNGVNTIAMYDSIFVLQGAGMRPDATNSVIVGGGGWAWKEVCSAVYSSENAPTYTITTNAIAPLKGYFFLGAGLLKTISLTNLPFAFNGTIEIIPKDTGSGVFTYDNTGNIFVAAGSGTAIDGRPMRASYDSVSTKWYMSY